MSTTRDEILEALTDSPEGLTSKELAPMCPACECDPLIVGRVISTLRAENVIHAGEFVRDGSTIWIFGKNPKEEVREVPITLPEGGGRQQPAVSAAALAIAAMRAPAQGIRKTSPAAPASPPQEKTTMQPKKTVPERVLDALKEHGHCNLEQLAKFASTTKSTLYTLMGTLQKKHGVVKIARGVYGLGKPSTAPVVAKAPAEQRAARPAAAKAANGDAQFAINEQGELGIETDGQKLRLGSSAFARLRDFITRTEPVWKEA